MAELNTKKPRVLWIDILRGFMMFVVIYGHITRFRPLQIHIYSYHMPIFFMISGMTFAFNKVENTGRFIYNKFFALMIPYFLLNIYVSPLREWLERVGECNNQSLLDLIKGILISNADSGYKMASNTTWFIPCLFITTVLVFLINKLAKSPLKTFIASLILLIIGQILKITTGSGSFWHIKVALVASVFYSFGYLFLSNIARIQDWMQKFKAFIWPLSAFFILGGCYISHKNGSCSMIHNRYHNVYLYVISALMTSLAIIFIIMELSKSDKFIKLTRPVEFVGKNTLAYIAFQVPIMKLFWYYIPFFGTKREPAVTILSLILFFGMMPLASFINRLIPKLKKNHKA